MRTPSPRGSRLPPQSLVIIRPPANGANATVWWAVKRGLHFHWPASRAGEERTLSTADGARAVRAPCAA